MVILNFFQRMEQNGGVRDATLTKLRDIVSRRNIRIQQLKSERCFYVELCRDQQLTVEEEEILLWIIRVSFEEGLVSRKSFLDLEEKTENGLLMEFGPRLNFCTPFSTNAVSIISSIGLDCIKRIECSSRYLIRFDPGNSLIDNAFRSEIADVLHDKMTECCYESPIKTFDLHVEPQSVFEVDVIGHGKRALMEVNDDLGLALDKWDLDYYTELFQKSVKRNPTNVECFDLAQSNSEHCRHWFFRGQLFVDGRKVDQSLFDMVKGTQQHSNPNNVIKFSDNSSAIVGYRVAALTPEDILHPSSFCKLEDVERHITFTAETHNFPTGVAPFPGATTGTGGRIRDNQATGRGAHVIAGTAGYCFGNLRIPGYELPWEDHTFEYPANFARPLEVAIEASNGASDYGNKFGEPVLTGFARSFGMSLPDGERREWVKPIMFSGGIGSLSSCHINKFDATLGMEVVKVGGPVYRIGVGGGAASSVQVQGDNKVELDFSAVQRGDAEMEQKMNRVIRACIERGETEAAKKVGNQYTEKRKPLEDGNPILSIHDQGAGGNGNVLKEICDPSGAVIRLSGFQLGDPTLSVLDIWGAEYQESNALLVRSSDTDLLKDIARRERCPVSFVGSISGDGMIRLEDDRQGKDNAELKSKWPKTTSSFPVDLDLKMVLGEMPQKVYNLNRGVSLCKPITLPEGIVLCEALERVLRLPSVASKRYLVNKVDRSVTGLVAQQQCVGPLHTPLADVAVVALSHLSTVGAATAIGEQPIKILVDPRAGARMSVGEALTNLVFAQISQLRDVKCSGNWMWPAKLAKEEAHLYEACAAMCDVMRDLGIAVDGGKDSLSMSARLGKEIIMAPGSLVVSAYAPCPDICTTVTPDLKCPGSRGVLLHVPLCPGKYRLGGSALAQCFKQIGDVSPDLESADLFVRAFEVTQDLLRDRLLMSGHDISDGGLITCLVEMAFAGNCSIDVDIKSTEGISVLELLFAEELGWVLEVEPQNAEVVVERYRKSDVPCVTIGLSLSYKDVAEILVKVDDQLVLQDSTAQLRSIWEATSFQLERFQSNHRCMEQEEQNLKTRKGPKYHLPSTFEPILVMERTIPSKNQKPKVAVIREEGSNGDREMVAALHMVGFEVWDVNMQDLSSNENFHLDEFRGIVFVGGFSYGDVLGSAKGWAATIKFNSRVRQEFENFYRKPDTFSLGVCNGCQLMALLGWVGIDESSKENGSRQGVVLAHNESGKFESRFSTVRIESSPSFMLAGMEGSVLGIWVAHGEGRMVFKNQVVLDDICSRNLVPLKYVDDDGKATTAYPFNPNGSPEGIAGLCSSDGRHLAMMPHPERCVQLWQWPWMPEDWKTTIQVSPWLCMFKNAFDWCLMNPTL